MERFESETEGEGIAVQKRYYEQMVDTSECGLAVVKMQADPEIIYANDYFYQLLQYSREEVHQKFNNKIMGPVLPDEQQKVKSLIARQTSMGGNIHYECRAARKDGSVVWLSFTAKPEMGLGSMVYCCTCIDISQSKRHLEDVYDAKRELDLIANSIPGGVVKIRMSDYYLLYANDGFFRLSGYSRAEYSSRFHNDCTTQIHPDDLEGMKQAARQSVKNMGPLGMEYRIISKNGEVRWSYVNGTRINDQDGEVVYLCVIVDITSRKKAEQELEDNNHRSAVITSMLNETIWTYELQSGVLHREGNLDWTYSPETIVEKSFSDDAIREFLHPEDVERFILMRDNWGKKLGKQRESFRVLNRAGSYRIVEISTCTESRTGDEPEVVYGLTRLLAEDEKKDASPIPVETEVEEPETDNKMSGKLTKMAGTAQAQAQDTITGLLPYAGFLRQAERVLSSRKPEEQYALVCADINEFRSYSHHYGFYISNRILKAFSDVLLQYLAKDGICSRVDGDYFVVLFQYTSHKELVKSMSSVVRHQQDLETDEEDNIEYGSTVGVYLVQPEDHELMDMLEKADLARRSIKGLKGNHYAIYTDDVAQQLSREDEMVEEVRKAMETHRVEVNYLPRICGSKENVIGCKAIPRILTKDGQYIEYIQVMHLM
jgi:PAS domain S-box-containing protein/diguanylate cyclase (GGDEF)-like protein